MSASTRRSPAKSRSSASSRKAIVRRPWPGGSRKIYRYPCSTTSPGVWVFARTASHPHDLRAASEGALARREPQDRRRPYPAPQSLCATSSCMTSWPYRFGYQFCCFWRPRRDAAPFSYRGQLQLAITGTAGALSRRSSIGCSCLACRRDRFVGPVRITTVTAARHHHLLRHRLLSQIRFGDDLRGEGVPDRVVHRMAQMMIKTLPLALLNSQLKTMTAPMI